MRSTFAPTAIAAAVAAIALASEPSAYRESIPGTLVTFEMVLVPGDAAFYLGRTEVTWDMYDVFALGLDRATSTGGADAVARPSQPYGAPDYGWGHAGYPVISVTRSAAEAFCAWLSLKTGKTYRLPTDAEWSRAASAAAGSAGTVVTTGATRSPGTVATRRRARTRWRREPRMRSDSSTCSATQPNGSRRRMMRS